MKSIETIDEFQNLMKTDKMIVIDFFADWCNPCIQIAPQYEELSNKYLNIEFYKCNIDNSELADFCEIISLPTFKIYHNGEELYQLIGNDLIKLEEILNKN